PECFVEISSNDAQILGLDTGSMVDVSSRRRKISAKLKVSSKAVEGTIFTPFHITKAAVNELTNAKLDPIAKIPEFKVCAIKIEPAI
ncbi:MAG: formate dehydrogenase subunit alpha, partial [Desulfobacula sp.]|uniref:molybdopterin dinucleotide binding domain-containing protein n=1 Tax=Desulfobacula sp. TaxID=2593537 RepID=UPI0025C6A6C8